MNWRPWSIAYPWRRRRSWGSSAGLDLEGTESIMVVAQDREGTGEMEERAQGFHGAEG